MKHVTRAAICSGLVCLAHPAAAFSNAPTFLCRSGLASSDASADVNIGLHKAVLSGAINYQGTEATEHPENAFDGDDNTTTGQAGNITVDLGAVYVVDSVTIKFASTPTEINISWSPYLGSASLPPTYNLATGLGHVPDSETANQDYRDLAWINDARSDNRKLSAQPARFLNFHFHQVYSGQWSNGVVKEIEIYGHPYVPAVGDEAFLSRKKWAPKAYADAAPNGEGETVTHAIDGQLTNAWLPHTAAVPGQWYQVDLGEEVSFNQIYAVFAIGGGPGASNAFNILASDDTMNWGAPIAQLDYGESATKSFPLQKKRYLRLEQLVTDPGWWQIDELHLLGPASASAGGNVPPVLDAGAAPDGGSAGGGGATSSTTSAGGAEGGASVTSGAGGSGTTNVVAGAGGADTAGGGPGEPRASGDAASTDAACACRGAPRGDHTAPAAWLLLLGAFALPVMRVRSKRALVPLRALKR